MPKFRLLYERVRDTGLLVPGQLFVPTPVTDQQIMQVHEKEYVQGFVNNTLDSRLMRRIGLPWSSQLVRRTRSAIGGTLLSARNALQFGLSCNLGGGTHHAFADRGAGYCIFHDMAIATRELLNSGEVTRVLIIDLDVHQGDGTARIFSHDKNVFTFSMHCEQNFPRVKQSSNLDIGLSAGTAGSEYLDKLSRQFPAVLDNFAPDLVFFDAGVDPHEDDGLGRLKLSRRELELRDEFVLTQCLERRIPVTTVIGGGYNHDHELLTDLHSIVVRTASTLYQEHLSPASG